MKLYVKDFWKQRDIVVADSSTDKLIVIGEVIGKNAEKYIHVNIDDLIKLPVFKNILQKEKDIWLEERGRMTKLLFEKGVKSW